MFARAVQRVALQKTSQRSFAAAAATKKEYIYSAKIPTGRGNWAVDERVFPKEDKKWFYILALPSLAFGSAITYRNNLIGNRDELVGAGKTIAHKRWEEGKGLITGERPTLTLLNH
eukprot:UN02813